MGYRPNEINIDPKAYDKDYDEYANRQSKYNHAAQRFRK